MTTTPRIRYKEQSNWLRGVHYAPRGDEVELLQVCGMYNRESNKFGLVRDHIFPRYGGFKYRVFPELLRHPANCRFIPAADNTAKRKDDYAVDPAEIESLFKRIEAWAGEWKEHASCLELIRRYRRGDCYDPGNRKRQRKPSVPVVAIPLPIESPEKKAARLEFEAFTARRRAQLTAFEEERRRASQHLNAAFERACADLNRNQSRARRRPKKRSS